MVMNIFGGRVDKRLRLSDSFLFWRGRGVAGGNSRWQIKTQNLWNPCFEKGMHTRSSILFHNAEVTHAKDEG